MEVRGEIRELVGRIHADRFPKMLKETREASELDISRDIERPHRERQKQKNGTPLTPVIRLYYTCRSCHADQPHGFTVDGVIPAPRFFCKPGAKERPAPACASCGNLPHLGLPRGGALVVGRSFTPYWDISGGANWRRPTGCEYVKGQGTYIPNRQALRDFARMNGREVR